MSSDLIGALLKRGEKLREAMVTTADEDNELDEPGVLGTFVERSVVTLWNNGLIDRLLHPFVLDYLSPNFDQNLIFH